MIPYSAKTVITRERERERDGDETMIEGWIGGLVYKKLDGPLENIYSVGLIEIPTGKKLLNQAKPRFRDADYIGVYSLWGKSYFKPRECHILALTFFTSILNFESDIFIITLEVYLFTVHFVMTCRFFFLFKKNKIHRKFKKIWKNQFFLKNSKI